MVEELQHVKTISADMKPIELCYYLTLENSTQEAEMTCYGIKIIYRSAYQEYAELSGKISYIKDEVLNIINKLEENTVTPTGMIEAIDTLL